MIGDKSKGNPFALMDSNKNMSLNKTQGSAQSPQKSANDTQGFSSSLKSALDKRKAEKFASNEPKSNSSIKLGLVNEKAEVREFKPSEIKTNGIKLKQSVQEIPNEALPLQEALITPDRKAMVDFLGHLEETLSINPEDFLQAFTSLDDETLALPPMQTIEQVIQALDVQSTQKEEIKALYTEMLTNLEELNRQNDEEGIIASFAVDSSLLPGGNALKNAPVTGITNKDESVNKSKSTKADLTKYQDEKNSLNRKEVAVQAATARSAEIANLNMTELEEKNFSNQIDKNKNEKLIASNLKGQTSKTGFELPPELMARSNNLNEGDLKNALLAAGILATQEGDEKIALQNPNTKVNESKIQWNTPELDFALDSEIIDETSTQLEPALQGLAQTLDGLKQLAEELDQTIENRKALDAALSNSDSGLNSGLAAAAVAKETTGKLDQDSQSGQDKDKKKNDNRIEKTESFMPLDVKQKSELNIQKTLAPTVADQGLAKIENFDEVIQKASYMAKDGGGEMKIQLRPDGLGQVDLKVSVDNGTVNVEMIAENAETKKLLEGGLDSLKHSLSSNKVTVDAIKVDIGNNLRNEMNQQGFNQDADQARQFMNDFRQENNSRRDGMNDLGVLAERARDRVQARTQEVKTSSTNTNPKSGSGRLHVVA